MRNLLILLLFASSVRGYSATIDTPTMLPVFDRALEKAQEHGAENVLLVMDIDNTLLTANQDFSSYAWNLWQKQLIKDQHPDGVTNDMMKFYKIENVLFTMANMHPPEAIVPMEVYKLQLLGLPVIALTSRGPQMRSTTERVLTDNKIHLDYNTPAGFPGLYVPQYDKQRQVSFQRGIYMTAGQHKGLMLKDLLERLGRKYKAIIFVDDLKKHTEHMAETFGFMGTELIVYRYGRMDKHIGEFLASDKSPVISQWLQLQDVWKRIFK